MRTLTTALPALMVSASLAAAAPCPVLDGDGGGIRLGFANDSSTTVWPLEAGQSLVETRVPAGLTGIQHTLSGVFLLQARNADGDLVIRRTPPPGTMLPLRDGAKTVFEMRATMNGEAFAYRQEVSIIGEGSVELPAGCSYAYKIVAYHIPRDDRAIWTYAINVPALRLNVVNFDHRITPAEVHTLPLPVSVETVPPR